MSFVTPGLLLGTLLVVLPIALHLIMRQRPRQVEFPPLRFLELRREANRRRLRLRQLLLLLLRCAAIALLALALARPTIQGSGWLGGGEAPVAAALVFDTAPHMDYRHRNKTRLDAARAFGLWLLRQLPAGSDVGILTPTTRSMTFAADRGVAKNQVERLAITPAGRPLLEVIADALRLLRESDLPRHEVYVFTDLSRSSWPDPVTDQLPQQIAETAPVPIYLIDVGIEDPVNFGLGRLQLSAAVLARNTTLKISTQLIRAGPEAQRSVELFVLDEGGQPRKRGHQAATWRAGQPVRIDMPPILLDQGTHQGVLKILGEDGLAWDDVRYFTVEVKPAWRVLVAATEPSHAVYLVEALSPAPMRAKKQTRFTCDVVALADLDQRRLADYAAVCLLDPSPLPTDLWQKLADYVTAGGGLAIFLGRHARPIESFGGPAAQQVLPAVLKRQWHERTFLAPGHLQHPVLAKFRAVEGAIPWQAFPVFTYWQLGPLAKGGVPIINYATGHPALVEMPLGQGRVVTMTTPVSDLPYDAAGRQPWNLLPIGLAAPWPFVMLTNELMLYLVDNRAQHLNYLAGDTVVLPLAPGRHVPLVLIETPAGDRLKQSVDPRQNAIVVTSAVAPGNYRARAGGQQGGLNRGFSVNLRPAATQLERVGKKQLARILGPENFRVARNRAEIDRDVNVGRVGRELFPYLIGVLALVLACEHVVANRFYREKP